MIDKTYVPEQIESLRYQHWESQGYFKPQGTGVPFCVMLPPPNVTGSLHMGHGFQQTLMDAVVRYQRMMGRYTLWQPGSDHAGISTQLVVEGQLEQQGLYRQTMTRDVFLSHVWAWKEKSGNQIMHQMRRLGASVDWSRERFTMDEGISKAVQKTFIQLYEEGLIYKGTRLVNWDPVLETAISDLEVISEEEQGSMWHIAYPIEGTEAHLVVATTRPETLLGDVAVAVHPEDVRYQSWIGALVRLPLCDRLIPVIADAAVDPEFGTGCVKITPAHDFNDYEMAKRHDLPMINIITQKGCLNEHVPLSYQGLTCAKARIKIVEDLTAQGALIQVVPHLLKVPRGEKSGAVIEPFLTQQWYLHMKPLAHPAIEAVRNGKIKWIPEQWIKTYEQWMVHIEDWCISRQLWWGHRIPAWYDEEGQWYVGYTEEDVRFKYQLPASVLLKQDNDVLDTWFSSALWPFVTLGWPEKTLDLTQFYPTSLLVTGFDIIFFWVARMIMMGLKLMGEVPFSDVVITGLVCDHEGKKMSKSKGNVLDPIDVIQGIDLPALIEKRVKGLMLQSAKAEIIAVTQQQYPQGIAAHGTDALRFTFCALASNARVVRFDLQRVEGYRHFCHKLWNAARYVLSHQDAQTIHTEEGPFQYSPQDHWIISRLQTVIEASHEYYQAYRFDLLANLVYDFVWHEYCDWYLELSKTVLYDQTASKALKRGARSTLLHVLDQILRLLHPMMPFITEEIWLRLREITDDPSETLMLATYPQVDQDQKNLVLESEFEWLKRLIQAIRTIRSEMNISFSMPIMLYYKEASSLTHERMLRYRPVLFSFLKLSDMIQVAPEHTLPLSISVVVDEMTLLMPMQACINQADELSRLTKEIFKLEQEIERLTHKLNQPDFLSKAPEAVVQKNKERLEDVKRVIEKNKHYQAMLLASDQ